MSNASAITASKLKLDVKSADNQIVVLLNGVLVEKFALHSDRADGEYEFKLNQGFNEIIVLLFNWGGRYDFEYEILADGKCVDSVNIESHSVPYGLVGEPRLYTVVSA